MRTILLAIALIILVFAFATAQTNSMNWEDTTRDIYIDGQIDRDAQVLTSDNDKLMVLISSKLKQAALLNTDAGTVDLVNKDAFKFTADRATAKSADNLSTRSVGKYTKLSGPIYNFTVDGKLILITRHEGALGEISEEKLWETVPVWHSLMENYKPNPDSVAALKSVDQDTQLIIVLGTWCHDSKNQVPRVLKAVEASNNKKIHVKLVALDHGFTKSVDMLERYQVTNTPTIIVQQNGRELGRINETPAVPAVEDDLVAILRGKPNVHHGTSEHGPQLAQGAYQYLDRNGKESGNERWQLYSTTSGGRLLHSEITKSDARTEIYYETDAKKYPVFIEITIRQNDQIVRERYFTDNQKLVGHRAGNSGVLEQTVNFPEHSSFYSPSVASEGWGWAAASEAKYSGPVMTYFALSALDNVGDFAENVSYESKGEDSIHVPAGEFRAQRIAEKLKSESREWYVHPQLGIPIKGEMRDGGSFVLTSLEITSAGK